MQPEKNQSDRPAKTVEIWIDSATYEVPKEELTGDGLRALPEPDIGPDRDLYLEGKGDREDDLIEADEVVKLKKGMRFFTAPATITPGCAS